MTEITKLHEDPRFRGNDRSSCNIGSPAKVTYLKLDHDTPEPEQHNDEIRAVNEARGAAICKLANHPKFAKSVDSSRENDEPAIVKPIRLHEDHDDSRYYHDRKDLDKAYETIDGILERHRPYGDATLDVREFLACYVCNARLSDEPEELIERHVEELIALSVHFTFK